MSGPKIYPVIHYLNDATSLEQAEIAFRSGADGVFLISHECQDDKLPLLAKWIKTLHPARAVGLNFLTQGPQRAFQAVLANGLDMVWGDDCGVSSAGLTPAGEALRLMAAQHRDIEVFASVAFKYQPVDPNPQGAALAALSCGFIPTTSGSRTGAPPTLDKITSMSRATRGTLAVASGMALDNVSLFAPHLSAILVSTAVSVDEHHFDAVKLTMLIKAVRQPLPADLAPEPADA